MSYTQRPRHSRNSAAVRPDRHWGRRVFLGFLLLIAGVYSVILGYHFATPRRSVIAEDNWLERCREVCLNYGLIPTGHIAQDAEAYLAVAKPQELAADFDGLWTDEEFVAVETQPHPLLDQPAPDFELPNDRGELMSLRDLTAKGPVVVVFYYGYGCSHCVAQLFGIQKDLKHFQHLGAQIVAISADPAEKTAAQFAKYGRFDFPVLSDESQKVAEQYAVYTPPGENREEDRLHGTFLVDRNGRVIFANCGYQPFLDNKSLLFWLSVRQQALQPLAPIDSGDEKGVMP